MKPVIEQSSDGRYLYFCPGCGCSHFFQTEGEVTWDWNGDMERPTVKPSVRVRVYRGDEVDVCHFFIKDGHLQYLGDCTHHLKGKTVPMVPVDAT